jgi:hypothetical protein
MSRVTASEVEGLRRIRRGRGIRWLLILLPTVAALVIAAFDASEKRALPVFLTTAFVVLVVEGGGCLAGKPRCPRCARPFEVGRIAVNPFARACVHCGLSLSQGSN